MAPTTVRCGWFSTCPQGCGECAGNAHHLSGPDTSLFAALPPPPKRQPRRERPKLLDHVHPTAICQCGHRADSHFAELPSPCAYGRTISDAEIIVRACDPELTKDPRYGCQCICFSLVAPS